MIKVTFKEPQKNSQDELISYCLFLLCIKIKFNAYMDCSVNDKGVLRLHYSLAKNIKSIENVKPTDL